MRARTLISIFCVASALAFTSFSQAQTIARLNRDAASDVPRSVAAGRGGSSEIVSPPPAALAESALSRVAARALFAASDLERARLLAGQALQHNRRDAEALFVRMEVADMQADDAVALDSALRLCEAGLKSPDDPRVRLAAARVRESAANTPDFRKAIPSVQALLSDSQDNWADLHAALLRAALDGAPGLDPYAVSRTAGILTDWRVVGPLGRHPLLDFDQDLISPADDLAQPSYQNHAVENFQFPDGWIGLPDYLSHRGIFYGATRFASLTAGSWAVSVEGGAMTEVYVDGVRVLRSVAAVTVPATRLSNRFEVTAGPHRVLAKFTGSSRPLRISIAKSVQPAAATRRARVSWQEKAYELAAASYASGDFDGAVRQITAIARAGESAPLQFLLAQALTSLSPTTSDYATAWYRLRSLAPSALATDVVLSGKELQNGNPEEAAGLARGVLATRPSNVNALEALTAALAADTEFETEAEQGAVWSRRLAAHPSCRGWQAAISFYRSRELTAQAASAQQKLDGCAPQSLDYARSLSEQGNHTEAAQALQRLLGAAPLDRAARLMLVRELQLAGDDPAAQRAAAEWLHIAPNAEIYHRLAAHRADQAMDPTAANAGAEPEFYGPYRRDAITIARQSAGGEVAGRPVVLLDDHVAISRPDGSVSLYVHTVRRSPATGAVNNSVEIQILQAAQVLQLRVLHPDGSVTAGDHDPNPSAPEPAPGDVLDQEYVVHFAGDGGIPEHPEAFQFVFGRLGEELLNARFVALTPADHADRGIVIATGEAPRMTAHIQDGMLARIWQYNAQPPTAPALDKGLPIVRVAEQDNGWVVPRNAERQRRIETIHCGPRLEESSHHPVTETSDGHPQRL